MLISLSFPVSKWLDCRLDFSLHRKCGSASISVAVRLTRKLRPDCRRRPQTPPSPTIKSFVSGRHKFGTERMKPLMLRMEGAKPLTARPNFERSTVEANSLKSREFSWMGARVRGEADRFRLTPMGFSLSEPRLEIFFDFDLFSCLNEGF